MDAEPGQRFWQRVVITSTGLGTEPAARRGRRGRAGRGRRRGGCRRSGSASRPRAARSRPPRRDSGARSPAPAHLRVRARLHLDDWRETVRAGAADCAALGAARGARRLGRAPATTPRSTQLAALIARARPATWRACSCWSARTRSRCRPARSPPRTPSRACARDWHERGRRRAFARRQRPVLLRRQPRAAARDGLDAVCFGLCPAGARRRRRVADGEPAGARRLRGDRADPATRPGGRRLARSPSCRASGRTRPARRCRAACPAPSTSGSSASSARAGRSGRVGWLAGVGTRVGDALRDRRAAGHRRSARAAPRTTTCCPSRPGDAYPVLHVLADLAEWRDGALVDVRTSDPLAVTVLALELARAGAACWSPTTGPIRWPWCCAASAPSGCTSACSTSRRPSRPWSIPRPSGTARPSGASPGGELRLELAPYAVARIAA